MTKKSRRHYVRRKSGHFFFGFLACFFSFHAKSKDLTNNTSQSVDKFSWKEHRTLSWADFKGPVNIQSDESAAATCCSIGFKLDNSAGGQPGITVYNTFYIDRSWVKDDAKIESILVHEQGHFDLCELYTRALRSRMDTIDLSSANLKEVLVKIYADLSEEYETRQQAYEQETSHGTNLSEQHRWQDMISRELGLFNVSS